MPIHAPSLPSPQLAHCSTLRSAQTQPKADSDNHLPPEPEAGTASSTPLSPQHPHCIIAQAPTRRGIFPPCDPACTTLVMAGKWPFAPRKTRSEADPKAFFFSPMIAALFSGRQASIQSDGISRSPPTPAQLSPPASPMPRAWGPPSLSHLLLI